MFSILALMCGGCNFGSLRCVSLVSPNAFYFYDFTLKRSSDTYHTVLLVVVLLFMKLSFTLFTERFFVVVVVHFVLHI